MQFPKKNKKMLDSIKNQRYNKEKTKGKGKEMKKKYYLVIDTETCNSMEQPLCYDIGYCIADRIGNTYIKRSFVVAETFLDDRTKNCMQSAYYAEKIPKYWEDIKAGKRVVKSIWNIRKQIKEDMKKYNVTAVCAYNMAFDRNALNTTIRYWGNSRVRFFFPFGTEYICIWHMACQVIMNQVKYIKFAKQNGLISDKGNIMTSAESCYKFLTDSIDFVESHTGLEDVEIEVKIMEECFRKHKKMKTAINPACWKIPQERAKAFI